MHILLLTGREVQKINKSKIYNKTYFLDSIIVVATPYKTKISNAHFTPYGARNAKDKLKKKIYNRTYFLDSIIVVATFCGTTS